MKQITVLRTILRRRGYLVLYQAPWHPPFSVGHITAQCGAEGFNLGLLAVRQKTTKQDFREQQMLSKKLAPEHWKVYSPTAMVQKATKVKAIFWRVTRTKRRG